MPIHLLPLVTFSLPAFIYLAVLGRRGESWSRIWENLGWRRSPPVYLLLGLGLVALLLPPTSLISGWLDPAVLEHPNLRLSRPVLEWTPQFLVVFLGAWLREGLFVALGEEVFFRGLLGGWLMRRYGFLLGNSLQTLAFLVPHLLVLLISMELWPLLIVPMLAGWLLGWLRYRSGSIVPGCLGHSFVNAFAALG